ncbi:MAG: DUF177 domain-containing protein [Rhizobiales bacterium]|nr:DUF177 domain-containing protein [Hyphomicrobiales bacterium]
MTKPDSIILDWKVQARVIGRNGVTHLYKANSKELDAIKIGYNLVSVSQFELDAELAPGRKGLITFKGSILARVEQPCIVTLLPVFEKIRISFNRLLAFETANSKKKMRNLPNDGKKLSVDEIVFTFDEIDPPDILTGNDVDLGEIALEEFILALNPYPRHVDAGDEGTFAYREYEEGEGADSETPHPFAALKKK